LLLAGCVDQPFEGHGYIHRQKHTSTLEINTDDLYDTGEVTLTLKMYSNHLPKKVIRSEIFVITADDIVEVEEDVSTYFTHEYYGQTFNRVYKIARIEKENEVVLSLDYFGYPEHHTTPWGLSYYEWYDVLQLGVYLPNEPYPYNEDPVFNERIEIPSAKNPIRKLLWD
jgi:hypothetical protein